MSYAIIPQKPIADAYIWRFETLEDAEIAADELCRIHGTKVEVFYLVCTVMPESKKIRPEV